MTTLEQYGTDQTLFANSKVKNLVGQRFGKLVVTGFHSKTPLRQYKWDCACDCGGASVAFGSNLKKGNTTTCGRCVRLSSPNTRDLRGRVFGRLTVVCRAGSNARGRATWLCSCSCVPGRTKVVEGKQLLRGKTSSCGCYRKEVYATGSIRHGQTRGGKVSTEYRTWAGMLTRCTNSNEPCWKDYGGRGIIVCPSWHKFEAFFADMGPKPKGLTLERTDVNGNYEKSNCIWADWHTQANNKRLCRKNKTGVSGVSIRKNRYYAATKLNGKTTHLGCYSVTPDGLKAAAEAIKKAKKLAGIIP